MNSQIPRRAPEQRLRRCLSSALLCSLLGAALMTIATSSVRAEEKAVSASQTADASKPKAKPAEKSQVAERPLDDAKTTAVNTEPEYVIGADDILIVTAPGHEELNQTVLVLPDGTAHISGIQGGIKVAGLTMAQLYEKIYAGLDRLYNNLELSISLKEVNSRAVTIVGTRNSGRFPLRKDMRVSGLIAIAGGFPVMTKRAVGSLIRENKLIKLDIMKIMGTEPDVNADPMLQVGDTVIIDYREDPPPPMFSVLGAVVKGGSFPMPLDGTPVTIARAVADAGGRTAQAALSKVTLMRKGETMPLNLYHLLVEGKADAVEGKILMENGDVLIIPELDAKYMVLGQVNRPSTIYIPEARSVNVQQALAEAGGPTQNGELRKAGIMRTVGGRATFIPLDLQKTLTDPTSYRQVLMQDGDVLYVPQKGKAFSIQDITSPLWVLAQFGLRFF